MTINKNLIPIFFAVLLLANNSTFGQQPGTLDAQFGDQGKVATYFNGLYPDMRASALQQDGKIICVGSYVSAEPSGGFILVRYQSNGSLDSSFGNNGKVFTHFGYDYEIATSVAIASDGSIIVGGYGSLGYVNITYDLLLSKYKSNGNLDSTFGDNGKVSENFGYNERISATLIQNDGKIVLCGNTDAELLITRFNNDGHLDATFGTNGKTITAFTNSLAYGRCATLQKDGKIIIAGNNSDSHFILARYLTTGRIDTSFSTDGKVITDLAVGGESINSIGLQSNGRIVVGGVSGATSSGSNENMTIARYNTDGSLDESFGDRGKKISVFNGVNTQIQKLLIRPDDNITVLGTSYEQETYTALNFVLAAFKENGNMDSLFGVAGQVTTDFGGYETYASGFLQPDGKIVLTGNTTNFEQTEYKIALARYFDVAQENYVHIKRWLHKHGITWEDKPNNFVSYYAVERSDNGYSFTEVTRIINCNNQIDFAYEDNNTVTGSNYYRLRTVRTDGSSVYSNVILADNNDAAIKIFPNPVQNTLHIEGLSPVEKTKLTLFDLNGAIKTSLLISGSTYNLNIAAIKQGNYLLMIENNGAIITKKFVKE